MNIKGLLGANISPQVKTVDRVDRTIKSDSSHDREANGQQTFDDRNKKQAPMTEEQVKKIEAHMRDLPVVKEHHWTIVAHFEEDKKFILIKDNLGNLIRKIPEAELWSLELDDQLPRGHLLKKAV